METAHQHLKEQGVSWVKVTALAANKQALQFYDGMGYEPYEVTMQYSLKPQHL